MRTIRIKLYKFSELSDSAKEKAIDDYRNKGYDNRYWIWDDLKMDAANIGLKIISFDHRPNKGEFIQDANYCANKILSEHGPDCDTYKTAKQFLNDWNELVEKYSDGIEKDKVTEENEYDFDNDADDLESEFKRALLEDYRVYYNNDVDYQNSDEAIKDTIEANEYEFTKDGKLN